MTVERWRLKPWVLAMSKVGWAAKAVVDLSIGWAAMVIATDRPGRSDAEHTGIVAILAAGKLNNTAQVATSDVNSSDGERPGRESERHLLIVSSAPWVLPAGMHRLQEVG